MKKSRLLTVILLINAVSLMMVSCGKKLQAVKLENGAEYQLVPLNEKNILMGRTEVTQSVYEAVMGVNPSVNKGNNFPAENLSWYDSLVFCNKLSVLSGKTPCYKVNGSTDVSTWNYTPHQHVSIEGEITFDENADGFHIPTLEEWDYAIRGNEKYEYSGSNEPDTVAWTDSNSGKTVHEVAQLKPNAFGIYDMSGNVFEWVWSVRNDSSRYYNGGCWFGATRAAKCTNKELNYASFQSKTVGMRVACRLIES